MKRYFEHVKTLPPHERRQNALRISAAVTGVLALGWLATLGVRLATPTEKTVAQNTFESQIASVMSAFSLVGKKDNTLEVSTTTNY